MLMAYVINRYNGEVLTTVDDGTVDQTLDIKLVGKNYAGYGEIQNEAFVHMLENFSGNAEPPNAISGQIWFDTSTQKLKFYTSNSDWKTAGGVEYGVQPLNPYAGDLWFDTNNDQLNVYTETGWVIIGPQTAGTGTTQMVSRTVPSVGGGLKSVIVATINDEPVYIISREEFTIDVAALENPAEFTGFTGSQSRNIKRGLTLPYLTNQGIPNLSEGPASFYRYHGTAASALGLYKTSTGEFISADTISSAIGAIGSFDDNGFYVGTGNDLWIHIDSDGQTPLIERLLGTAITFRFPQGTSTIDPVVITNTGVNPGTNNTYTLGTGSNRWSTVFATTFNGTATQADTLKVGTNYLSASTSAAANTIAVRDSSGNLTAGVFSGVATSARYADLAEIYKTDVHYDVGTVVAVGGNAEVRATVFGDRAIGAISEKPAYLMNKDAEGQAIALKGRVPVRVVGAVSKGDRLVATDNGCAIRASFHQHSDVFAIALESNQNTLVKLVECVIL
jgi:hypothetical protein